MNRLQVDSTHTPAQSGIRRMKECMCFFLIHLTLSKRDHCFPNSRHVLNPTASPSHIQRAYPEAALSFKFSCEIQVRGQIRGQKRLNRELQAPRLCVGGEAFPAAVAAAAPSAFVPAGMCAANETPNSRRVHQSN
mgnify:CR=1 FL=1